MDFISLFITNHLEEDKWICFHLFWRKDFTIAKMMQMQTECDPNQSCNNVLLYSTFVALMILGLNIVHLLFT